MFAITVFWTGLVLGPGHCSEKLRAAAAGLHEQPLHLHKLQHVGPGHALTAVLGGLGHVAALARHVHVYRHDRALQTLLSNNDDSILTRYLLQN